MVQAGLEVTPSLNRLASHGTLFSRAYTTCPLCVPARTALATGLYPTGNGIVYNDWRGERAGDHRPIHQYLAEAGYDVAHIGVHHVRVEPELRDRVPFVRFIDVPDHDRYLEGLGLDKSPPEGMDAFRKPIRENQEGRSVDVTYSSTNCARWHLPSEHFKDNYFCAEASDFIRSRDGARPFALFVSLWAPHPPLRVPEPYASMFDPAGLELPPNVNVVPEGEPENRREGISAQLAGGVSMDEWRKVWAAHLGLVRLADDGIGRVLAALGDSGLEDDTIVFFSTDHGDHLGQRRMYQKMEMYEPALRIPMIWRVPGGSSGTCDTPVSHLDVVPTLLEATGLSSAEDLDGVSLLPTLSSGAPPPDRCLFSQYSGNPTIGDIRRAAVTRQYKYVYDPAASPELYDLEQDPLEMRNLAQDRDHLEVRDELHHQCAAWGRSHGDWVDYGEAGPG